MRVYIGGVGKLFLAVVLVGVAVYLVVRATELWMSRRDRAARRGPGPGTSGPRVPRLRPPRPSGPIGPDDDPEFLRDLNRRKPKDDG